MAANILGIILGVWLAFHFSTAIASWLDPYVESPQEPVKIIVFVILLAIGLMAAQMLGKALTSVVKIAMLGWLNRLLGIVLAFVKVFLILGVLVLLFDSLNVKFHLVSNDYLASSLFYGPLKDLALTVYPYIKELFAAK